MNAALFTPVLKWVGNLKVGPLIAAILGVLAFHFHARLLAVHAEFDTFRAQVKATAKQAETDQRAANHVPAILSEVIAKRSNDEAPAYYERVRAAAERVRIDSSRCPSPAGVPGTAGPAEVVHGPAEPTRVVPEAEFQQLTDAAARASQMHADAQAMIAAGIAVAETEN